MSRLNAARWERLKEIVCEAMDRPPGERTAWVAGACAGDAELESEVHSLLARDQVSRELLDGGAAALFAERESLTGREAGAYRLLEEIGHGGMGTVYLAERIDGAYEQRVAIKVIRRGMDTDHVLRRFRNERQILASLNHANIARLLDGGALLDGRPYLVMEHVDGRRIDRYCDEERLTISDRLRLFLQVCDAVSFAHQRLVVHRDLKPGNVLVGADGRPKLLDFGIAKLLGPQADEEAAATETLMRPMTPEYASPEQIAGQPVTTATDVYALGVMLYELLTGHRPHASREKTIEQVLKAIRENEPLRPSQAAPAAVRRRLRGDLDVILLTALRKEPERRYASSEAFAADLRRHLDGRPVQARRESWTYRTSRFLARNAVAVGAGMLVATALIAGTVIAMQQADVARRERAVAERRLNDTLRLTNTMLFEFYEAIDHGPTFAREVLAKQAFAYLDPLSREAPDDPRLLHELATAYSRLGGVQSGSRQSAGAGGNITEARASLLKARRLRERLLQIAPDHYENRRDLGILLTELAAIDTIAGHPATALPLLHASVAALERAASERPDDRQTRDSLVIAQFNLAQVLGSSDAVANVGRASEAAPHLAAALRVSESLLNDQPDDLEPRLMMIALHNEYASCMEKLGRASEAHESQRKAIAIGESLVQRHPDSLLYRRELAVGYGNLAAALLRSGDKAGALEYTLKALPLYEHVVNATPKDPDALRDLAIGHRNVGKGMTATGDPAGAQVHLRRALDLMRKVVDQSPESAFIARQLAFTHLVMAETLLASGDARGSLAEVARGIAIGERLLKADASNMVALRTLAQSYGHAGKAAESLAAAEPRRWSEARAWYVRSREAWSGLAKGGEIAAPNVAQVEAVNAAIARCDEEIARTRGRG